VVTLVEEIGQPLFQQYERSGLPREDAVERVAENLAQRAENDPYFRKILQTVLETASEESETWVKNAVKRAFEIIQEAFS
jgi:hypothetical protein